MFISDNFLVDYAGYKTAVLASLLGSSGRAIHTSTKLNKLIVVTDDKVYLVDIFFDQNLEESIDQSVTLIGTLQTSTGVVYVTENNKPQVVISDGVSIYFYDPSLSPSFQVATADGTSSINFIPGYIDFHDTYILAAASNDTTYTPPANNTWRLGTIDPSSGKLVFPSDSAHVGLLQTKSDNVKAVVRFPSKGNMIFVMGSTVTEPWFDVGYKLFPYQRNTSFSIDYGCVSAATIATNDELVVWLAQNEKSGPVILYSTGGMPEKITTDGIDFLFAQLKAPQDSQAFMFRQDGHLFYHINFYTDNFSLFIDFSNKKIFHACDENLNYFIAAEVAFFKNQYYFVTKNNGNIYSFDSLFTTYDGAAIQRIRTCGNIRDPQQDSFIANDVGFTIEQGETPYQKQFALTQTDTPLFLTQDDNFIVTQDDNNLSNQQNILIGDVIYTTPRVDLSISTDGGASFGSDFSYSLNGLGQRKNKLMWWQIGKANDLVCQFKFWGLGRFVATDGVVNIRR